MLIFFADFLNSKFFVHSFIVWHCCTIFNLIHCLGLKLCNNSQKINWLSFSNLACTVWQSFCLLICPVAFCCIFLQIPEKEFLILVFSQVFQSLFLCPIFPPYPLSIILLFYLSFVQS